MTAQTYPPGTVLMRPTMDALARNWWVILMRGILAIIFGGLTLAWPQLSLLTLVFMFGVFAFMDGIFALAAAVMKGAPAPRWWLAMVGVFGILAGAATFVWPNMVGAMLLYFIAGWAIAGGILQIFGAIKVRAETPNEWLLIASGILQLLFGILILLNPAASALGMALAIATFAIVYGVLLIAFSFRLKSHAEVKI